VTQGATTIVASIYRARGQAGRFAFVTTVFTSAGRTAVALAVLAWDLPLGVVLWSFVGLNAILIALTWQSAMRGLGDTTSHAEGDGAMQLGGIVWSLMGNLDVVVVGVVLGSAAAGRYGAALRLAEVGVQFLIALAVLYLPEATRLAVGGGRRALADLYRTTCRWSTLVSVLVCGIGFLAAPDLARLLIDRDVGQEAELLRVLFVGYAVHGALGQTYSTLLALGSYDDIRRSSLVSLPLIVGGTIALAAAFGVVGAAWATGLAYAATGVWWAVLVHRHLGAWPFDAFYARALAACAAAAVPAAAAAHVTSDIAPALSVLVIGAVTTVAWAASVLIIGGLSPGELRTLQRLRRRRLRVAAR
jgi:O-antigen/teichoic acid export membrane protein